MSVAVTFRATPSSNGLSQSEGTVNISFIPDAPRDPSPSSHISVENSSSTLYDLVDYNQTHHDTSPSGGVVAVEPSDIGSMASSSPTIQENRLENRLENWQERAREIRTENRKKTSVGGMPPLHSRSQSTGTILDEFTAVAVTDAPSGSPLPATRQRRFGRVEYFKQSRLTPSPVRSVSQTDMHAGEEYVTFSPAPSSSEQRRLQVPSRPGRKISRIRAVSPMDHSSHRDSPDEGIHLDGVENFGESRDSLAEDGGGLPVVIIDAPHLDPESESGFDSSMA